MAEKRRIGRFKIAWIMIKDNLPLAQKVLSKVVSIKAEALYYEDTVEYVAYSDIFDEIELGCEIPTYEVRIIRNVFPMDYAIEFIRVE